MRIKRFSAKKIHGYKDIDISFNDNLTFLTGINGTGKTTALNSMVALLSPSLQILSDINYESVKIEFTHEEKNFFIEAIKKDRQVTMQVSGIKPEFSFARFVEGGQTIRERDA